MNLFGGSTCNVEWVKFNPRLNLKASVLIKLDSLRKELRITNMTLMKTGNINNKGITIWLGIFNEDTPLLLINVCHLYYGIVF